MAPEENEIEGGEENEAAETEGRPTITVGTANGMTTRPMTDAEIEADEKREEKNEQREAKRYEEAGEVLALLDPIEQVHVVPGEIEVGDQTLLFHFRVLSFSECSALEAKKYRRGKNGQLVRDVQHEETNTVAWLLHWCVVKDANFGKDAAPLLPDWKPMFKLEEVREKVMGNTDPKAMQLLYGLTAHAWSVNPQCNPLAQAQALQDM